MSQAFRIVIPMAGLGSRMRPHTWVRPKPLLPLAGKTVLDHALDQFSSLPDLDQAEYVFIISPNQGDLIQRHMREKHPDKRVHFVLQEEMRGQSDALWLAREYLDGPMLMAFSDTLLETDLTFLSEESADVVAWVKPVEDPRRFGVIEINQQGWATRLIEKPTDLANNLVLVGFYYFRDGKSLVKAIETQMERGKSLKGEYFLADAINIMIETGSKIRKQQVDIWLDAGIPEAILETNRYLLDHQRCGSETPLPWEGVTFIPPVYVAPDVNLESSVIGPHVSIARGCSLSRAVVRNSILDEGSNIQDMIIEDSLVGRNVTLHGKPEHLNIGDNSQVKH